MHKRLLAFFSFLFLLAACGKDDTGNPYFPTGPTGPTGPVKYTIEGVHDTSLEQTGTASVQVAIKYISGGDENVTIGVSGLPKNVRAFFDPVTSSKAPYNTVITFIAEKAKAGTYPINVIGSTLSGGVEYFPMTLTILPYSNVATGLAGSYEEKGQCVQIGNVNNPYATVEADPQVIERIRFKGLWTGVSSYEIYADMTTGNKSLNIPPQTVGNGVTFEGFGHYTDSTITIEYTINGNLVSDTCATVFTAR